MKGIKVGQVIGSRNSIIKKYFFILFSFSQLLFSQSKDSVLINAHLTDCIHYAMQHQPYLKQSVLDEAITKQTTRIALSDWMPQFGANANLTHYNQLPTAFSVDPANPTGPKRQITTGLLNTSSVSFYANQALYSNDLLQAGRTAKYYKQRASQNTQSDKTDLVLSVSKAFYDAMLTEQQLNLLEKAIERLNRNLKDAYSQYQSGITDKIDYKRATIALNNARADKKRTEETIRSKNEYLKQLMGYPVEKMLSITYDSAAINQQMWMDTTMSLPYQGRIEYQILQTQLRIQKSSISYYRMGFLPTLSAFANYNMVYQNDQFSQLYQQSFPNSYAGLTLSLPLFTGTKRIHALKRAKLQYEQLALDTVILKSQFQTQYVTALGSYKSNLAMLQAMEDNLALASDVYRLVKLQYERGIKTYLEVIVAETDLRSAEINRLEALFHVVSDKLDVQRAMGTIPLNY